MRGFLKAAALVALAFPFGVFAGDEQRKVDDLEARIKALEAKIAESEAKAEAAGAKAKDLGRQADEFRRTGGEQGRTFNDERGRADRERRRIDGNVRTAEDAKRQIADLEKKVAERKQAVKSIEDIRRDTVNDEQVNKLKRATQAQQDIQARIDLVRKILAAEEPERQNLVQENRQENELVTKDGSTMKMVDAFELAKEIETAITESYKDIKATQTAIERKMSFDAAQKITDVAKAVRLEADRAAIEDNPRTKEALDAQKSAQTEVVRETDNIVETVVAMMEEAMELVKPDDGSKMEIDNHPKAIPWMSAEDFAKRAQEEERRKRLEQMMEIADFQVAINEAAAENEEERAKDLTKVMEDAAEVKKNTEVAEAMQPPPANAESHLATPGATVAALARKSPDLLPGNVLRVTDQGSDGIPAKWMYVQSWYVIGPFPNPNRVNLRRKFPPESVVDLDATYIGKNGKTIRWEFMQANNVDPKNEWSSEGKSEVVPFTAEEYGIWYAYAEVFVDAPCERWIAVGSDDRSDIWINDVPVWGSSNKLKSWRVDEGYRRIRLNRGRNRILARIENGWHVLGWSVAISVEDGALPQ